MYQRFVFGQVSRDEAPVSSVDERGSEKSLEDTFGKGERSLDVNWRLTIVEIATQSMLDYKSVSHSTRIENISSPSCIDEERNSSASRTAGLELL